MQPENIPLVTDPWLPIYVGIITAGAALLGVIITAIITAVLKNMELKSTIKEEKRLRCIDNLEALHKGLVSMIGVSARFVGDYSDYRQKGNTSTKEIGEILAKLNGPFEELWSTQRIHFPDGDDLMNEVYIYLCKFIDTGTRYLKDRTTPIEVFEEPQQKMLNKCLELREMVKADIQKLLA